MGCICTPEMAQPNPSVPPSIAPASPSAAAAPPQPQSAQTLSPIEGARDPVDDDAATTDHARHWRRAMRALCLASARSLGLLPNALQCVGRFIPRWSLAPLLGPSIGRQELESALYETGNPEAVTVAHYVVGLIGCEFHAPHVHQLGRAFYDAVVLRCPQMRGWPPLASYEYDSPGVVRKYGFAHVMVPAPADGHGRCMFLEAMVSVAAGGAGREGDGPVKCYIGNANYSDDRYCGLGMPLYC